MDWIAGLPTTAIGFDIIQNHVDLLSGKVHAVPTRSTATATDAAAIIRDMCLRSGDVFPDVLTVDHDSEFTSEVFRAFVKGWGSCLIVGSAYHKNTNAKVDRANSVVSDTLRLRQRTQGRLARPPAAHCVGHQQHGIDARRRPDAFLRRPRRTPSAAPVSTLRRPHSCAELPAHYAQWMRAMEVTVQELLAAAQKERKAKLRVDTAFNLFKVGDQVMVLLRTKELLDAADIGKLRPQWDRDGPCTVMACPSPNAYTLALPRKMRCSPTVNVDRLKPFFDSERAGAKPAPGPVSDVGQEGKHEVELLLNRRFVCGVLRYLVRWRCHTSADNE